MNKGVTEMTMESFRNHFFARLGSAITAFFFTFVFYLNPTGLAVANEITKEANRDAALEAALELSPEMKFSHRVAKLYEKVSTEIPQSAQHRKANRGWFARAISNILPDSPITELEMQELRELNDAINAAYTESFDNFEAESENLFLRAEQSGHPLSSIAKKLVTDRHQQALARFKARYANTQQMLSNLLNASSANEKKQAIDALADSLNKDQLKPSHTPVTPNNLPWSNPSNYIREPVINSKELHAALSTNPYANYVQLAQAGDTDLSLIGQAMAASTAQQLATELGESIEVQLTPSIKAKAMELHNNPAEIYAWVHNSIRYIPSHGSIQGAQYTLDTMQGNAIDTASLLIALLRASNIPARYAYGTVMISADKVMNWVGGVKTPEAAQQILAQGGVPNIAIVEGGKIASFKLEHVWVEAWVDYFPGRGTKGHDGDNWIPMDASFKQYIFPESIDLKNAVPVNGESFYNAVVQNSTVNTTEGWVQNLSPEDVSQQITQFQSQIENYLNQQNSSAQTLGDVIKFEKINVIPPRPLAAGLPYDRIITSNIYAEVPDSLRHKFAYDLAMQNYGYEGDALIHLQEPTAKLAGKTLSLSFRPATKEDEDIINTFMPAPDSNGHIDANQFTNNLPGYLIHLKVEFSVDGVVILEAPAGTLGAELNEIMGLWSPKEGWSTSVNHPAAGEYRSIGLDLQGSNPVVMDKLRDRLEATRLKIVGQQAAQLASLTHHDLVDDVLSFTVLDYFVSNDIQDMLSAQVTGILNYRLPSYGTFSTQLKTEYWYGIPRSVGFAGLSMDVDHVNSQRVSKLGNPKEVVAFNRSVGVRLSAMEHAIPERIFSSEQHSAQGISAIKALSIASQQGQKIWIIDNNNLTLALDQINLSADTETDIRNSVNAGKVVTASESKINFNGWIGEGYIVNDPNTGAGAYIISGGSNGGVVIGGNSPPVLMATMVPDFDFGKLSILSDFFDFVKVINDCFTKGFDQDTLIGIAIKAFIALVIVALFSIAVDLVFSIGALIAAIEVNATLASIIGYGSGIVVAYVLDQGGWKLPKCK